MAKDQNVESDRVFTAKLPADLAEKLDDVASRLDRSRSWIIRQAVAEWLAEEDWRHELTHEALAAVDAGLTLSQEDVETHVAERRAARAKGA